MGIFSRIWNWIWNTVFSSRSDVLERRLQYISKEEAKLISRIQRRSQRWERTARNLIIFFVILEIVAIGYAIMTTRTVNMDWRMRTIQVLPRTVNMDWRVRSLRVLPMFLLPALLYALRRGLSSWTTFGDRREQKTLEKLRAETRAILDELKPITSYLRMQQLLQKYDPDYAANAAAAYVLAPQQGADSGLRVLRDESQPNSYATSNDVEVHQTTGLRRRNQSSQPRSDNPVQQSETEIVDVVKQSQVVDEHHDPAALGGEDGDWIARIAAMLAGDELTQSYARIWDTVSPVLEPSRTASEGVRLIENRKESVGGEMHVTM